MRNGLALLLLALGGCLSSDLDVDPPPPPEPPGGDTARQLFERDVYPKLSTSCIGCHATTTAQAITGFVGTTAAESYDIVVGSRAVVADFEPANAPILTLLKDSTHKGFKYSTEEAAKVTAWLTAEVDERDPQDTDPQPTSKEALIREWSGCMSMDNYQAANMGAAWRNVQSDEGACSACHTLGEYGFQAGQDTPTFQAITEDRGYMLQYFHVGGTAQAPEIVPNNEGFRIVAGAYAPHYTHPLFNLENAGMDALVQFHELTKQRKLAGACDPSRLP